MKTRSFFRTLSLIVISAITAIACEGIIEEPGHYNPTPPDPGPQTPSYTITVTPNGTVNIPAEGGTKEFTIKTNAPYYGYSFTKKDWMKGSIDSDKMAVVITFTANDSGAERSNEVTFYGKEKDADDYLVSEKVKVVQPALATASSDEYATTASIDFGSSSISAQGCEVMTIAGSYSADASSAAIKLVDNGDIPQLSLLCNSAGEVVMLSRDLYSSGTQVTVNAKNTALALVTMHPLFAPVVGKSEFTELKKMILNASTFSALEQETSALIKAKKPLFSKTNTGLKNALQNLLNEVCIDPEEKPRRISNVSGLSGEGPFKVSVEGKKVSVRSMGLTPMYTGVIKDWNGNKVDDFNIKAGDDYGLVSYWFREDATYNPPVTYDLSGHRDGEYTFYFSRNTTEAQVDFASKILLNMLDVVGAKLSTAQTKTLEQEAVKFVGTKLTALPGIYDDGEFSVDEAIEAYWGLAVDFASSDNVRAVFAEATKQASFKAVANKLNTAMALYTGARGSANALFRIYYRMNTPAEITFCLCHKQTMKLYPCGYVTLDLISGGGQSARAGEVLNNPIKVRVDFGNNAEAPYLYALLFSVISGEGTVSDAYVYTEHLRAQTWWTLGPEGSDQMLRVDAIDPATGAIVSEEPLYVHATCTDAGDYNKDPVPTRLQGVWRMTLDNPLAPAVTLTLGEQSASYHDPSDPSRDFSNYPVYSETLSGGKYNIRFYDTPVADGSDQIFLQNIQILTTKVFDADRVWKYYQKSRFTKQDELEPPFKQVSVLCQFTDEAGVFSRVSMTEYQGSSKLDVQQMGNDFKVKMQKGTVYDDEYEICTFTLLYVGPSDYVVKELEYSYHNTYVWDSSTNPVTKNTRTVHLYIDEMYQAGIVSGVASWIAEKQSHISYFKKDSLWPEDDYYYTKYEGYPIGDNSGFTIQVVF